MSEGRHISQNIKRVRDEQEKKERKEKLLSEEFFECSVQGERQTDSFLTTIEMCVTKMQKYEKKKIVSEEEEDKRQKFFLRSEEFLPS